MTSTQGEPEFPFDSEEEYELILGESFLSNRPNAGFHTIRYDFKPASVDTSQSGNLDVGKNGEVNVSLPNTQDSGTTVYRGSKKPCPKECILVVDKEKRTITLERLASTVQLKKIRSASGSNAKASSSQGSQQNETSLSQEDINTSTKASDTSFNVESTGGSSNSSSSESDSDLEDVDEEVASIEQQLHASLIEQTNEQNKVVNARPESSSSFNLCEDLELSESGSDSD
ncbi:ELL-associated factor 2-like [Dendronephthya gigantea]|uniref:ELL-associated factor 2-like n=1 Tax=Dendronephthya gigantea TaxID=151771 RepID=UPI0010699773|nr:ELL-associated factor 2-like [Dendronephthya gigantea]